MTQDPLREVCWHFGQISSLQDGSVHVAFMDTVCLFKTSACKKNRRSAP